MLTGRKLCATLLPVAAFALMIGPGLGLDDDTSRQVSVPAVGTLDAAPRGRGPIRGARPVIQQPTDATTTPTDDAHHLGEHPRRLDGSRSLPEAADGVTLTDHEPIATSPRGARS
jgi:hypothetical protein